MHPRFLEFGHIVVPTYGVFVALGIAIALVVCFRTGRLLGLDGAKVWNVALLAIVVSIASGKLLLLAVDWPRYGLRSIAFGLEDAHAVSWGAVGIAAAVCCFYARRAGAPLGRTADALAPALAIFGSSAAIGCLEAGCGYGVPTRLPWAVVFTAPQPSGAPVGTPLHPTQLYSSIIQFCLFGLSLWLLHRPHRDGDIIGAWLFVDGLSCYLLAFLRGDGGGRPLLFGLLSVTQIAGALMVLMGAGLWLSRSRARQPAPRRREPHVA